MKKFIFLSTALLIGGVVYAQSTVATTGGDVKNETGSMSFTIGQVATQNVSNTDHSISEGVQQPYEIQTVGVDNYPTIQLEAVVFPNPTDNLLTLQIPDFESFMQTLNVSSLQAKIFDGNGKLLETLPVTGNSTQFHFGTYAKGTYMLLVFAQDKTLKTFKVVKQ